MRIDRAIPVLSTLFCILIFALPSPAAAQFETPPEIQVQTLNRRAAASVAVDGNIVGDDVEITETDIFRDGVRFRKTGFLGSEGYAFASQYTDVSRFLVSGSAVVEGEAYRDSDPKGKGIPPSALATAESSLSLEFVVPVDAEFTLQGRLNATGDCCLASGIVVISGVNADGAVFSNSATYNVADSEDGSEGDFLITGTVGAGQVINFAFSADLYAESSESVQLPGRGHARIDFKLDFGDRDGDGLLDDWEENGIDFAGSAPRIDLPGLGANPDHKDIFVELDLMQGVPFTDQLRQGPQLVANALARVPRYEARNPDGQPGYNLHVVIQEDERVPFEALSGDLNQILSRLDQIKTDYFGIAEDRENPAVIEARKQIFRYGLWADTITEGTEPIYGAATIGGPNFVMATGSLIDRYSLSSFADLEVFAVAGSFGHELGHSLGLDHGGQDSVNYKPNYLSLMNYAYHLPVDAEMEGGGNLATTFFVDYSRYELCGFDGPLCRSLQPLALNEGSLLETETIQPLTYPDLEGPLPGAEAYLARRFMWWNSASETDPEPVRRVVGPVLGDPDWNDNATIDTEVYILDLSRITTDTPADYQTHKATTDFVNMRLPIMEDPLSSAKRADLQRAGMSASELDQLESLTTVNRMPKGEVILRNGFELTLSVGGF